MMNVRHAMFAIPGGMGMAVSSATGAVQAMDVAIGGTSGAAGTGSGAMSGAGIVENDAMIAARGGFRAMIALRHILSRKKRSKRDASR